MIPDLIQQLWQSFAVIGDRKLDPVLSLTIALLGVDCVFNSFKSKKLLDKLKELESRVKSSPRMIIFYIEDEKPLWSVLKYVFIAILIIFLFLNGKIPLWLITLLITILAAVVTFRSEEHPKRLRFFGATLFFFGILSLILVTGPAYTSLPSSNAPTIVQPISTSIPSNTPTIMQPTSTPVPNPETFKVSFTKGRASVTTSRSYDRPAMITVTGVATAQGVEFADAFYVYSPVTSPTYRADTTLWINGKPSDVLVKPIPRYNGNHKYTFTLNASGGRITFGVGDVLAQDKTGSFTVTVV